jgi:glycosyltransferase involved in cell wall biosynthesis
MKILVVQDHLRSGGTERQSILLARAFAAAGHASTLLTFRPGGVLAGELSGASHNSLLPFDLRLDWFAPGLLRAVAAAAPDVVLCMGRMANCYAGFIQRRNPRLAVIGTMRTGKTLPFLFRRSLRRVRHIVANSHAARQTLIDTLGMPPAGITVIHNSLVFRDAASPKRNEELRAKWGAGPATTILLCVAMFRPGKNQEELIEIAAGLPAGFDFQLWLAGKGETQLACMRRMHERCLGAKVRFFGWQRDPTPFYAAADIAVHASHTESLSNFVIEAQACGLPAVVCDVQGISECFVPDDTGFVLPHGDRDGFRRAIQRLAGDTAPQREARAARARAYALATFDPQNQMAAYLDLFARLAQVPAGSYTQRR